MELTLQKSIEILEKELNENTKELIGYLEIIIPVITDVALETKNEELLELINNAEFIINKYNSKKLK